MIRMKTLLGMMLMVMALPMVASAEVLLDQNFDGAAAGANLETLGWSATGYTVSSTAIDSGNSTEGGGDAAEYLFNHTLGSGAHYQIDAVVHGVGGPAYFWAENAAGDTIFLNHYQAWGNAIEFQSQAPAGVTNTQRIGPADPNPRTVRLEIYENNATLSYDPDSDGNFAGSYSLSDNAGEQFGFSDLKLIKMSGGGGTFYDSISVQVIPEPSSIVLLVLGSLIMLQRRR